MDSFARSLGTCVLFLYPLPQGLRRQSSSWCTQLSWVQTTMPYLTACRASEFRWALACLLSDRKSTRLNSSHGYISYAVFCLKKKINADDLPPAVLEAAAQQAPHVTFVSAQMHSSPRQRVSYSLHGYG